MSDQHQRAEHPKPRRPWHRRPGIVGLIILAAIVIVVAGTLYWRHAQTHVSSDDAYIDVVPEHVSPQVSGRVLRVLVRDNEDVRAGQELVEIDPADYLARLAQAQASLAQAQAQVTEALAQRTVYAAQLAEAQASMGTSEANAANADSQMARYRKLKAEDAGAVSGQQWDSAVAADRTANAQLAAARKAVQAAQAQFKYADALMAVAKAGIVSAQAQLKTAELNLSYTRVKARLDGRISSKTVAEGNYVTPGTALMAIVPRDVYITANFKETQLAKMRPGQAVKISVDAYPDLKLTGRVDSVQPSTGQSMSILPAENATGNWVKVVQRVPVKIDIDHLPDEPGERLGLGMSVEVSVDLK